MPGIEQLIDSNEYMLGFYSPYSFAKEVSLQTKKDLIKKDIITSLSNCTSKEYTYSNVTFIYSFLNWDTNYFGFDSYKLQYILYDREAITINDLELATVQFADFLKKAGCMYCFIEVPSEDIASIQALTGNGFRLIETRLTYYRGKLETFTHERYNVRAANPGDILNLKRVAKSMRNDYDRFHADPVFSTELADEFLATYIEQSIKGFVDYVMVPDEPGLPADSFLTANYFKKDWNALGCNVSKMVLSAVSSQTNKGWYKKLISEMTYHLQQQGAEYIYMNTQSTNRAVFHTWETLGYKMGSTTHILAKAF